MNEPPQFVLVLIRENALMRHWSFRAADELAVARHVLHHAFEYEDVFWALRISLVDIEGLEAKELLQAIHDSYFNQKGHVVLYLLPVEQTVDCLPAESPTPSPGAER